MKQAVLIIALCLAVTACGKKPNNMTPVAAPVGLSDLSQPYPMIQPLPPVETANPNQ